MNVHTVVYNAKRYNIPVVRNLKTVYQDIDTLVKETRDLVGGEGHVVQFEDGHMIKVKGDWYLAIHKAKENILYERLVVQMIIEDKIDDVLPFLIDSDRERIGNYIDDFVKQWSHMARTYARKSYAEIVEANEWDNNFREIRKNWALQCSNDYGPFKTIIFRHIEQMHTYPFTSWQNLFAEETKKIILYNCNSNSKFAEFKKAAAFNMVW